MAERKITPDEVIAAALDLLDEVGLDGFTMRALATRLGTYPATIYWHVGSRSEVLSAAGGAVIEEVAATVPNPDTMPWREWLAENARAYRQAMLRHPAVATWSVTHLEAQVPVPGYLETMLGVLAKAGFQDAALIDAYNAYLGSLIGWVGLELIRADADHGADPEKLQASIAELSSDDHPLLVERRDDLTNQAFTFRWATGVDNPLDDAFEFALATWISGLAAQADPP